jgi:hypothetical protein
MVANPFQQLFQRGGEAVPLALIIGIAVIVFLVAMAIQVAICWFLSSCFSRIPKEYRRQEPGMVWLLLVPCLNLVWNFFVYPKLAESYKAYFEAQGRTDVGDCGYGLGMAYSIAVVVTSAIGFIPVVSLINCLFGPALLVVFIMFLVKAAGLKAQIPA